MSFTSNRRFLIEVSLSDSFVQTISFVIQLGFLFFFSLPFLINLKPKNKKRKLIYFSFPTDTDPTELFSWKSSFHTMFYSQFNQFSFLNRPSSECFYLIILWWKTKISSICFLLLPHHPPSSATTSCTIVLLPPFFSVLSVFSLSHLMCWCGPADRQWWGCYATVSHNYGWLTEHFPVCSCMAFL